MEARPHHCRLDVGQAAGVTVVHMSGDESQGDEGLMALRARLCDLLERPGGAGLVLDLAPVAFLDSSLMGTLVLLHKRAKAAGRRLALCGLGPQARWVLGLTRLDRVLQAYGTEAEAVAALAPG
jgi:anti-sigma B factor antagonist